MASLETFTTRTLRDAPRQTEGIFARSCVSREEVDALVQKAVAAGGSTRCRRRITASCAEELRRPGRAPLGVLWMDPKAVQG